MRLVPARRDAILLLTIGLCLVAAVARAADPQPYAVELKPTGDAVLDQALHDSASLIEVREKVPAGGFALLQRAQADIGRFQDALQAFGYYKGTVQVTFGTTPITDPGLVTAIDQAPAKPPLPIAVAVDHGPRFHLGRVIIDGALPPGTILALNLKPGQDAVAQGVLDARDQILGDIREAGYPLATVTMPPAVVHLDQGQLDVLFHIESGPRAALGRIDFTGLRRLSEAYMRKRLTLHAGEQFSPSAIKAARDDLASVPAVASVSVEPATQLDAQGNLPLTVEVAERPLRSVEFGAAYSTDIGVSVNASWTHRNLFGNAEQLILSSSVQLGGDAITRPGYLVGAQFIKPDFLARDQSLTISLNAVDQSLLAYHQTGLIERAGIDRKLSPHWSVQAGVMSEQERIIQVDTDRYYYLVGFPVSARYDTTNDKQDPTSGLRATLSLTPVESFGKPGGTYFITQLSGSAYFDLAGNGRSVVATRGLVGQVAGISLFGMPPDQRFYAGGNDTVRGYRFQSVGPAFPGSATTPTGGTAISAGSLEFRQRFLEHWGAAVFADVGQVSTSGTPFASNWHAGAGAGLRYYTPIGPIRVDIAVPLNRELSGDSFELYIGLGQSF